MLTLKRLAGLLPRPQRRSLKSLYYAWRIRSGTFRSPEPDFDILCDLVGRGDWVLDIGANVGHYTLAFSNLVGPDGHVFAWEPIPETFALLVANLARFPHANVTPLNLAASDRHETVTMEVPTSEEGPNYYTARITSSRTGQQILAAPVDGFEFDRRVALVKIDVEGHEFPVLKGMCDLLERDHPHLIVETSSRQVVDLLAAYGYTGERLPGSPNLLFRAEEVAA